jgi:hypothetical protein
LPPSGFAICTLVPNRCTQLCTKLMMYTGIQNMLFILTLPCYADKNSEFKFWFCCFFLILLSYKKSSCYKIFITL